MAFTPKSRDHRAHPAFKAGAMVKDKEDTAPLPVPSGTPVFAFANQAASMSPAVLPQNEDDDVLIGYGTALVSCVISLALGFSLGYGT